MSRNQILRSVFVSLIMLFICGNSLGSYILIPMDQTQRNHLKAYGITYWVLDAGVEAYWLLNYRGGSFAFQTNSLFEKECKTRDVTYQVISNGEFARIRNEISHPEANMETIKLETAPKIAVYTPDFDSRGDRIQPWDDAVTLVLTYAEIPYDKVYDREVLAGKLSQYDWLHLHHEDFTGQYGKFYRSFSMQPWYRENQKTQGSAGRKPRLCESFPAEVGCCQRDPGIRGWWRLYVCDVQCY